MNEPVLNGIGKPFKSKYAVCAVLRVIKGN